MMAKKQVKKGKGHTRGARAAGPLAALYNLGADTPKGSAVRTVLAAQGIRVKTVTGDMLGDAVGAVAGLPGFKHSSKPYVGDVPEEQFMLLHGIAGQRLTDVLAALREADASVGCKAQVTQHNRLWPFATLVTEVAREHRAMTAGQAISDGSAQVARDRTAATANQAAQGKSLEDASIEQQSKHELES